MNRNPLFASLAVAAMLAAGTAAAQTPAPGKGALKADREAIKADRGAIKADRAAIKADREKLKADRAAGNKDAAKADREKLRADRAKQWRLVDHVAKPQQFDEMVKARAAELAQQSDRPGGQGIALAGLLLAEAAVAAGRNATHAQAYGPESRGGASKAEVIISDGEIEFPCADRVDALVALTREAYDRYVSLLEPDGTLVVDRDQVPVESTNGFACHALPIAATAQHALGTTMGANLVALGAIVGLTAAAPVEAVERVVAARRPGGSAERALTAFRAGLALVAPS